MKNPKIDKLLTEVFFNAEKFNKINITFLLLIFENDCVQKLNDDDAKMKHSQNQSTIRIENDQNGFDEKIPIQMIRIFQMMKSLKKMSI